MYAPTNTTQECVVLQHDLTAVSCRSNHWQLAPNPAMWPLLINTPQSHSLALLAKHLYAGPALLVILV